MKDANEERKKEIKIQKERKKERKKVSCINRKMQQIN